jgi:hypothetical protein
LLQKQKGFKEEITMCNSNNVDAVSISLWDNKADADNYSTSTYPQVLKTFEKVIDGTPRVHTYETVTSTIHSLVTA